VRAALGNTPIPGRILPAARTISNESARSIFDFIVRANLRAIQAAAPPAAVAVGPRRA
jgi:hypothetical protein